MISQLPLYFAAFGLPLIEVTVMMIAYNYWYNNRQENAYRYLSLVAFLVFMANFVFITIPNVNLLGSSVLLLSLVAAPVLQIAVIVILFRQYQKTKQVLSLIFALFFLFTLFACIVSPFCSFAEVLLRMSG